MGFLYRFLNEKGEVIYIGKTVSQKLEIRMKNHAHLSVEAYLEKKKVEYVEIENQSDLAVYEIIFINHYKPKYNQANKYDEKLSITIPEFAWYDASQTKRQYVNCKKTRKRNITAINNQMNKLINQIELYNSCGSIVPDMIRYFKVAQCQITDETIESINLKSKKNEYANYPFTGTYDQLDILTNNMVIRIDEYVNMKGFYFYGMLAETYPEDEEEGKYILTIRKHLLPYLYCIKDNLNRECSKAKYKLDKMQIELHSLLKT